MAPVRSTRAVSVPSLGALLCAAALLPACAQPDAAPPDEVASTPIELPEIPPPSAAAAEVPPGYRVEVVVSDLVYPTSVEFDDAGTMYIAERGYAYGDEAAPARILRVFPSGETDIAAEGAALSGPITDLLWHDGVLYISHRGKISTLESGGGVRDLVTGLPSLGDHHNNQLTVGPDNRLYLAQGTVTNSGVVGLDNFRFGWLPKHPEAHDIPARDIRLTGQTFRTQNPNPVVTKSSGLVTDNPAAEPPIQKTSAFHAYGESGREAEGEVKASGTVLRFNPDGSGLEVYAWGLRNPFGLMWSPDGTLYAADNGYDDRGSRPIGNAPDVVWTVRQGAWYGFPDYAAGVPVTDDRFVPARGERPKFLLKDHPRVEQPFVTRPVHAGVTKMDVALDDRFGAAGDLYLGEAGAQTPITGPNDEGGTAGHQVVRIDPGDGGGGAAEPFFRARGDALGPAGFEYVATAGPKVPVDVRFSPDGEALYIADFGAVDVRPTRAGPMPRLFPGTGVIWRIVREGAGPAQPPAGLSVAPGR